MSEIVRSFGGMGLILMMAVSAVFGVLRWFGEGG